MTRAYVGIDTSVCWDRHKRVLGYSVDVAFNGTTLNSIDDQLDIITYETIKLTLIFHETR